MLVNLSCFAGGVVVTLFAVWLFKAMVRHDQDEAKIANDQRAAIYRHIYDRPKSS